MNTWNLTFGPYALTIDRKTLRYRLTDTTGTVWADDLPLGGIVLENVETGETTHHDFADARLVSLSEKASHQGKRILFGLDVAGVPIDIYLIGSQSEIQITVEASRDTRAFRVVEVGLLPELVAVPDDGVSYLVLPIGEGAMARAADMPDAPGGYRVWRGLRMPFVGAVRGQGDNRAALGLITDSAYAVFRRVKAGDGGVSLSPVYTRDPERRRLDIRLVLLPGGDHIAIARAYRDKIVGERNHVTLRRKIRDRPRLDELIGTAFIHIPDLAHEDMTAAQIAGVMGAVRADTGIERSIWSVNAKYAREPEDLEAIRDAVKRNGLLMATGHAKLGLEDILNNTEGFEFDPILTHSVFLGILRSQRPVNSYWEDIEARTDVVDKLHERGLLVSSSGFGDWASISLDTWSIGSSRRPTWLKPEITYHSLPLESVVYHDSVITQFVHLSEKHPTSHLNLLLLCTVPSYDVVPDVYFDPASGMREYMRRTYAVLGPLHRLTFPAFLVAHRFLTDDFLVEEAVYSDKTRVVINQHPTDAYESDDLHLPPHGFYVRHGQMEAHHALRIGDTRFDGRAWRVRRSRDGKSLETSDDVLTQEFPA